MGGGSLREIRPQRVSTLRYEPVVNSMYKALICENWILYRLTFNAIYKIFQDYKIFQELGIYRCTLLYGAAMLHGTDLMVFHATQWPADWPCRQQAALGTWTILLLLPNLFLAQNAVSQLDMTFNSYIYRTWGKKNYLETSRTVLQCYKLKSKDLEFSQKYVPI